MNASALSWHRLGKCHPAKGFKYYATVISRNLTEESWTQYFNDKDLRDEYVKSLEKDYVVLSGQK